MNKKISIFFPVYNEEKILKDHILKITDKLKAVTNIEYIIIDDSSTDKTPIICKKLSKNNNIRFLRYNNGPSRRENLAISFKKALGDIVVFMDMDLATDVNYTHTLFKHINNGFDIAIGSRNLKKSFMQRSLFRKIISNFYNIFIRLYFGSKVKDHQCGFKAFRKDVIMDIVADMGYDKKFLRGWFWDAEVLIRAQKKGYKIVEFPIKWKHGEKSEFNIKREFKMIPYIISLRSKIK